MRTIDLTERSRDVRAGRSADDLPTSPGVPAIIVSCIDARVDPVHLFGIEPGEASVFRTIGGRLTDETIAQIGMIAGMAKLLAGDEMELDVALVHHTECGAARFSLPPVQAKAAATAGVDEGAVAALAIDDPTGSVRDDLARLAGSPVPRGRAVAGDVYDVGTGSLVEIVPSTTLAEIDR